MIIVGIILAIGGPFVFYWIFKRLPGTRKDSNATGLSRDDKNRPNAA
jgi:hypothetical protein